MKKETSPWKEKVAVITGASSGIGAATAIRLAREGLHVILIARRQERLDQVASQIQASDGLRIPLERFSISPETVAGRIWELLNQPARTVYIPRILALVPWLELSFGRVIDRLGPLALRRHS